MQTAPEFIIFLAVHKKSGKDTLVRVNLRQPVRLYDETRGSGYRAARVVARRRALRELELHPCAPMVVVPHDWSDGVGTLSESANDRQIDQMEAEATAEPRVPPHSTISPYAFA